MTSTEEITKVLLEDEVTLEVLREISIKEHTLEEICEIMHQYSKKEIENAVDYLDRVALTVNIFTRSKRFYKMSATGLRILEITEEAVIEEANTNG